MDKMEYTTESFFKKIVGEVVEEKLDQRLAKLEESLLTKLVAQLDARVDKVLTKVDEFIKEVRDYRDQQSGHQIQHNDIRSDLDQLKEIHPQGHHATA